MNVSTPTSVAPLPVSAPTLTPSTIAIVTIIQQAPTPLTTAPSTLLQDLPNFSLLFRFDHLLKTLEANFSEFMQINQFAGAISSIPGIIQRYMDQRMNKAVKIIKEQVKVQVKVQVSKILPKIEQTVNEQLEAKVLTRSSNSSKTSYAVAANLSEMELKKILIEKMEGNKSIHRSNEQKNLYKALVEVYESDKIILDIYEDTITLKRCHDDDAYKDKEPSAGSDRGSKRRREGKEPESASAPKEKATRSAGKSTQESKSRQTSANESAIAEEPMQTIYEMEEPSHPEFEIGRCVIPFDHFINNDLEYLRGGASSCYDKHALWGISHWGRKRQQFYGFAVNQESARDVYSKHRIIAVTELKIVKWHNYKYLDWIMVRKDDDKLYKFKEGDFKRLRIQDIEDMLLLLVQGKLTNLTVEERFAFNNKDKQNRLMRIDELQKFSDRTLTDVRTALDDRLKGIRMKKLKDGAEGTAVNVQCYNCSKKGYYAYNFPKPRIKDSKYFMEQMLLAKQDEAGVILTDEQIDFLFADVSRMEEIEELCANIFLMARIKPTNIDGSSNDFAFLSEVQTPSTSYVNPLFAKDNQEKNYPMQPKIINL
uniref:Uncharacterized protein n=1 Tax=Tanacetum cinerariifolium TaxID=118510 RepID=A0A6L2LNZ2_TANCI|nr:hypothetical protein [Tanacetum cinerariifolium]